MASPDSSRIAFHGGPIVWLREPHGQWGPQVALGWNDGSWTQVIGIVTIVRFVLVVISTLGVACHEPPDRTTVECSERSVRMGVASSLREVAHSLRQALLARDEPIEIEMIFGASSALARQLTLGAPMDLLVSADEEIVSDLVRKGLLIRNSTLEFARGRLAVAARSNWLENGPKRNAIDSSRLKRIAIPSAAVPLGRYARDWLESMGRFAQLEGKIVTTEHARATLSAVEAGHVDLAIVYESDARLARRAIVLERIDPSEYPPIRYVAARTMTAPDCPSIDEALSAWKSPATSERLAQLGFLSVDLAESP